MLGATLGALLLVVQAGGVLAQTPEPVERTPEMEQHAAEMAALFPAELGGVSLVEGLGVDVGQELLAEMDPSDPDGADDIAQINELVEAAGATVDDMATAVSFVELDDGMYGFLAAYQIRGADATQTLPLFVAAFLQDVPEARVEQGQIANREVTLIYEDESPEADPLVLWASGDVTWFVGAPEQFLEEAVASTTES
jgi:hypothetical protein